MILIKCKTCKKKFTEDSFKKRGKNNKETKSTQCIECREKAEKKYVSCKENNICPNCYEENTTDAVFCEKCTTHNREKSQKRRDEARAAGMCSICFIRKAIEGHKTCPDCKNRPRSRSTIKQLLFRAAKARANQKEIQFTISQDDIIIPTHCPILGYELTQNDDRFKDDSFSLDRIDNSKGYIPGNIHVISMRANIIKGDASIEELEKILIYLKLLSSK